MFRQLGKNGPNISTVGFGAWAAGGPWKVGWGPQSDEDSIAAIRRSFELGMNWIDTAAIYGLGHSEVVTGQAIAPLKRDEILIFTKCGRVPDETGTPHSNLSPGSIRTEITKSLERLDIDYIDLYQFHWPDLETATPIEESWTEMAKLQDEGLVRWIGVSNFDVELLSRCEAIRHVDSLQPPFSMVRQDVAGEILPWCLKNGTGVIVYSPMQSGLLSGTFEKSRIAEDDWRHRSPYFQEPQLSLNMQLVEALRPIAARHTCAVGNIAVAWTLANPAVTAAIVGARNPVQVEQNLAAMHVTLTRADLMEIQAALDVRSAALNAN